LPQWELNFATDTLQYHVQDTVKFGDLTINLGWKGFQVINKADPVVAGGRASGRISAIDWFQPTVGAAYKLGGMANFMPVSPNPPAPINPPPPAGLSPPRRPGSMRSRAR
jgi:hypothetical protein